MNQSEIEPLTQAWHCKSLNLTNSITPEQFPILKPRTQLEGLEELPQYQNRFNCIRGVNNVSIRWFCGLLKR